MSFLFNFASDEDGPDPEKLSSHVPSQSARIDDKQIIEIKATVEEAKEVTQFCDEDLVSKFETIIVELGQQSLKVMDTSKLGNLIVSDGSFKQFAESKNLTRALSSNSDLVAGVYEGGLKMWECGKDLAQFLASHPVGQTIEIKGKSVLELGCGAGLPGLYCCSRGARIVHFQDFNEEVLQLVTHTNVAYNTQDQTATQCRYFSGDWSSLCHMLQKKKQVYDLILTAETIYSPENYASLHAVFCQALSPGGAILVAAKGYYFGVGGSTDGFIEYVESQKCFAAETVDTIQTGVPRKIIRLHHQGTNPEYR